jgi:hypothetical protein
MYVLQVLKIIGSRRSDIANTRARVFPVSYRGPRWVGLIQAIPRSKIADGPLSADFLASATSGGHVSGASRLFVANLFSPAEYLRSWILVWPGSDRLRRARPTSRLPGNRLTMGPSSASFNAFSARCANPTRLVSTVVYGPFSVRRDDGHQDLHVPRASRCIRRPVYRSSGLESLWLSRG